MIARFLSEIFDGENFNHYLTVKQLGIVPYAQVGWILLLRLMLLVFTYSYVINELVEELRM